MSAGLLAAEIRREQKEIMFWVSSFELVKGAPRQAYDDARHHFDMAFRALQEVVKEADK